MPLLAQRLIFAVLCAALCVHASLFVDWRTANRPDATNIKLPWSSANTEPITCDICRFVATTLRTLIDSGFTENELEQW